MQTPRPSATRGMFERVLSHVSRQRPRERNRLFNQALSARISIERFDRLLRHFFFPFFSTPAPIKRVISAHFKR